MRILNHKRATLMLLIFIINSYYVNSQNYFSNRIDVANKLNEAGSLFFINDTFYIAILVYEVPYSQVSTALLKIDKQGNLITAKRFKPNNRSYFGGGGGFTRNGKIYTCGLTDWGLQVQQGLYTFDTRKNCDTVYTRSYGDTSFYNLGSIIQPYLKTKNKLLLFGITDSTCGVNHPGLYKPSIRVIDTNGVLYQTKLFNSSCIYSGLGNADTTTKKGYVFCGFNKVGIIAKNYITKLDSNLNQLWGVNIDTTGSITSSIISTKKGKLVYTTNHTDSIQANTYYWDRISLTKLDINGNILWRKRYSNAEKDIGVTKIKECANGDFILCGQKYINYTNVANQLVGWLMRTDSMGNLKWWKTYLPTIPIKDTIAQNYLTDIMELPNKDIAAVGYVGGTGTFSTIVQTWLLKVDSNGCFGVGNCPLNIAVGIKENSLSPLSSKDYELNIYPNPAQEVINVELLVFNKEPATILITNTLGQVVYQSTIINQQSTINVKELPAGIYFAILKIGTASLTKKIIIER